MTMGASRTSEIDDSPDDLSPSNPLAETLAFCGRALSETYSREQSQAAAVAEGRRKYQRAAAFSGAAAILLLCAELAAFGGHPPPGATTLALRAMELAFGLAGIASAVLAAAKFARRKQLVAAHRAGLCPVLKFRFLIDPDLWSRRGSEAEARRRRFEEDARVAGAAIESDARAWVSAGSVPNVRELPVGSHIDPHSVHVLVDYYQGRRLNPALSRLADQAGAAARSKPFSRQILAAFFYTGLAVLCVHSAVELQLGRAGALSPGGLREFSLALAALAVILPAVGAAVKLGRADSGAAGSRSASRHQALSALSERLQKVSGAEAIFRELNFCEDVLEGEAREDLLRLSEPGG
jgi:hypothetical protein